MHLTPYEMWEKYGKFGSSVAFRKLFADWKRKGLMVPMEVPISATNLHVKNVYCEKKFCELVVKYRSETYVGKIFSRSLFKIKQTLATDCDKPV